MPTPRDSHETKEPSKGSTLGYLHPSFMDELRFGLFKDSLSIQGSYRMNLRQPNRQPEHSREYQPGDPTRLIDWKAYAKHDQLIVREIQDEASAKVSILIDASESMEWPPEDLNQKQNTISKIECAVRVGMAISYAHLKVGDRVQIYFTVDGKPEYEFKPRSSTDVVASFDRIAKANFTGKSLFLECQKAKSWPTGIDRVYLVSDLLYLDLDVPGLGNIPKSKSMCVFHLLSSLESDPEWIESNSFYHDNTSLSKEYQGRTLVNNAAYLNEIGQWQTRLQDRFQKLNSRYIKITDQSSVSSFMYSLQRE
jgi:hypothetical protein